jgi:hypothetical protein
MELELEMGPGLLRLAPGQVQVHLALARWEGKVPFGAFLSFQQWRSARRLCRGEGGGGGL